VPAPDTDSTVRQIEFELEKAEHGMALPYDAERIGQLRKMLVEARKRKLSAGLKARREQERDDHAHHPPQGIGEVGRGTANPAYKSTGAGGGDCWSSIWSPGFSAALPR
jgi:hypothetical protein